ncbi:MAG: energy transducer TonB [Myxococcota bacterium]
MAFEAFLTQEKGRPKKWRRLTVTLSLAFHGALLIAAVVYSFWHVDELSPPVVTVTFLAATPPPPPPPPPKKKTASKVKPVTPKEIVQPKATDIIQPKEKPEEVEHDDGVEGGVEGGVAGGVVSDVAPPKEAPPPPPPAPPPPPKEDAPPKFVPPNVAAQQLLTDPRTNPAYRVIMPAAFSSAGMRLWAMVKICVSKAGSVADVKLIKGMDPAVDPLLLSKIRTWRYRPMSIDGQPIAFCYNLRYEHATQ